MHILARQKLIYRGVVWSCVTLVVAAFFWLGFSLFSHVETVQRDGVLRVVMRNDSRHFSNNDNTFEMTLTQLFANELEVELQIQTVDSLDAQKRALRLGFADMAAGGLVVPEASARAGDMVYSDPYMDALQQVVYKSTTVQVPEDLNLLTGGVRADSPQARTLRTMELTEDADIQVLDVSTEALLNQLSDNGLDYAVIDSNDYAFYQPFFPRLRHAFDISEPMQVAWMFNAEKDGSLRDAANQFLNLLETSGQLEIVLDQHFGHLREFDYVGIRRFERHVNDRLPRLRDDFESAAEQSGLDWRLLAAVGYQESHWRPNAVSPTGVRGIMMLTLRTAGDLGVTNRLDPSQSIHGGARYLSQLYGRVPDSITDPDRMWYALAAYNVGMGHVMDARSIAESLDINPNYWTEMQQILPKLRDPEYYRFTRFGFARGDEPVIYVQNIRRYYDLLRWMFPTENEEDGILPGLEPESPNIVMPPLL